MSVNTEFHLIDEAYQKMMDSPDRPVDNKEEHIAAIKQAVEKCIGEMNNPEATEDHEFSPQITPLLTVLVIGVISSVVLGLTGGIPLLIASAITTVTLLHILLARIAYNVYQQEQI